MTHRPPQGFRRHLPWMLATLGVPLGFCVPALIALAVAAQARGDAALPLGFLTALLALASLALPILFAVIALRSGWRVWRGWRRSHGHLMRKERAAFEREQAFEEGWRYGLRLNQQLQRRELPEQIDIWNVVPFEGECFFLNGQLDYARYYGTDVAYTQSTMIAFGGPAWVAGSLIGNAIGNAAARSRAERFAQAAWREYQPLQVIVSNQRIRCNVHGRGWLIFDFSMVTAVYPDPQRFSIVLEFQNAEPMLLTGPMVPALSSIAVLMTHGADAVSAHPGLLPLRA